jgi:hypothetical protein
MRSLRRMNKVIRRTIYLVFTLYSIVGAFGYIGFAADSDILSKYAKGVILVAYGYPPNGTENEAAQNYNFATLLVQPWLEYVNFSAVC